ncbi:MAG: glycerol-3-phosphate 1-O-acyltransferase PlsY [Spirochaetes bacterium]|nr:glycerol-3-phosphate 1-O-acyltransferase PlsY [Spirochaetota bacterium]
MSALIIAISLSCLAAYLTGAIPFSFLIARMKGVDLRKVGSGNIGATNVIRSCGKAAGAAAYVLDISKGVLGALWVLLIQRTFAHQAPDLFQRYDALFLVADLMPIVGHMFPVFLKFKGGKGVATSAGVFLFLIPVPLLGVVSAFLVVFLASRIISLSSIVAAFLLPILFAAHQYAADRLPGFLAYRGEVQARYGLPLLGITAFVGLFIVWRHRENIRRIARGEEHRFGSKKK